MQPLTLHAYKHINEFDSFDHFLNVCFPSLPNDLFFKSFHPGFQSHPDIPPPPIDWIKS